MRQMLRLVAFSFLFAGSALLFWPRNHVECAGGVESQPCKLVAEALETASKMKVGILRADVERDFELDGGMSVRDRGTIRSWGGPGKGTVEMDGARWIPYQAATFPTPPFPDYVSGHSTYSAAAARILALWAGNDRFGDSVTLPAGSSKIEPGTAPAHPVVLSWPTFTDAADEAGLSRRYGGIHFRAADLAGRLLGRFVATEAWRKAASYFDGTVAPQTDLELATGVVDLPGSGAIR